MPDIDVWNEDIHINVEVTQTIKSQSDREYPAIKDHLSKTKALYPTKKCFVWYVSPETHYRMFTNVKEHNRTNAKMPDMKIMPFSFLTFELIMDKLITSHKELYPIDLLISLFASYESFTEDNEVLKVVHKILFPSDTALQKQIEIEEENNHQQTVESLIKGLLKLEGDLRKSRIATSTDAIRNVIYLVFIKLYEEKREAEEKEENRFTKENFKKYQSMIGQKKAKTAIRSLFKQIINDSDLKAAKMFDESDKLAKRLNDNFVIKHFIEPFEQYHFYKEKIDGLGAAYEVLGKLSGKDVILGQFFTPQNVVKFMVKLAELDSGNLCLDPACGTARFLIESMEDMVNKLTGSDLKAKEKKIKTMQLYGDDGDSGVAKLAKMNMYIHGDGKSNILDQDGLLLDNFDDKIDVILTNPPLGDISYMQDSYDQKFYDRMVVIPRKNLTTDKLKEDKKRLEEWKERLDKAQKQALYSKIKKCTAKIREYEKRIAESEYEIRKENCKYKITGNEMKGGALFVTAAKYYLKDIRNPDEKIEWRGGKLLIILDEGILNDDGYKPVRDFIRRHFYIKAIISLTRDTFVPVSNTSTKTSILYAIKKEDPLAIQQEPIFYAHASKVGIDTRKRVCANDLGDGNEDSSILTKYFDFKRKMLASYDGQKLNRAKFLAQGFKDGKITR